MQSMQKKSTIKCIFLMILIIGLVIHIVPYFYNRSLWIDEAFLVSSILQRSVVDMLLKPLDWGQSAPIGYLYIVKLFSLIGSGSELSLRLWSLLSFFGSVTVFFFLLKDVLGVKKPEVFTAIFAILPFYIYFSNEAKQYMSDNFFVILTVYLFGLYQRKKLSTITLSISYALIIWFSFSSIFFIAGSMLLITAQDISILFRGNGGKKVLKKLCVEASVAVSFALNYLFWLLPTSKNVGDPAFWEHLKFPLIPKSLEDYDLIIQMLEHITQPIRQAGLGLFIVVLVLTVVSFFGLRDKRRRGFIIMVILSSALILLASSLGYFPIIYRTVQFVSILLLILSAVGLDIVLTFLETVMPVSLKRKTGLLAILFMAYSVVILYEPILEAMYKITPDQSHVWGSEVKKSMEYLQKKTGSEDMIYINRFSIPVFQYETDYVVDIGDKAMPYIIDRYIYGSMIVIDGRDQPYIYDEKPDYTAIKEELKYIQDYDSVYIFSSHLEVGVIELLKGLRKYGSVTTVSNYYGTKLYHYLRG